MPLWLKYSRLFLISITILMLILVVLSFWHSNMHIEDSQRFEAILNRASEIKMNYIRLSKLVLAAKYYDPAIGANLRERVTQVTD